MDHAQQLEAVRNLVLQRFANWSKSTAEECCETILVQDGCYCGRRFTWDGGCANWLIEQTSVRFYDRDGELLEEVALDTGDASKQAA